MKSSAKILLIALMLTTHLLGGCASKRALRKPKAEEISKVSQKDQDLALKLFKQGSELLMVDDKAALSKFLQALEHNIGFIPAYFNAGLAEENLGNYNKAAQYYEGCLSINKQQASCLENLLIIKHKLGEQAEALHILEGYSKDFPKSPFVNVARAKLAFVQKEYDQAELYARKALELDAENVEALYIMARIFYERKAYAAAKWVIKNALEIAPSHGGLFLLLGQIDQKLGLLHDAMDAYASAVKYYPSEEALESYGLLLRKRGRVAESLAIFQKLSERYPTQYRHFLHLANAYMANKNFDEAKKAYIKAQELEPNDHDILFNLGLLYLDLQPENMSELERLSTSESYFKSYLAKPGADQTRINEAKNYLSVLERRIEIAKAATKPATLEPEEETATEPVP